MPKFDAYDLIDTGTVTDSDLVEFVLKNSHGPGTETQRINLTQLGDLLAASVTDGDKGDITVSASGATWTIDSSAVTYAKIQNISATDKLLGRSTAGAGVIEEIACTSLGRSLIAATTASGARTTLDAASATHGHLASDITDGVLDPARLGTGSSITTKYLRGDGTWQTLPGLTDGDKGDITVSASGATWTIDNSAVTYAKIQNVSAASRILGRGSAGGAGVAEELTIGTGLQLSGTALSCTVNAISNGDKGDITVSANGATWTIDNGVVSYAKIQNVSATDKLLGRSTAGAGVVEEITCTSFGRSLIDDADATAARTTLGLGTLATQNGTFSGTSSGTNTGDQTITLSGDVSGTGTGSFTVTIATDAVTYAKMQNVSAASRILGRGSAAGAGDPQELTIGTGLELSGTTLNCTVSGAALADGDKGDITVSSSGATWTIDNAAVSYAKIQNVSATDKLLGRSTAGAGVIEEITCTSFARSLLDDADASTARTTLGLGTLATQSGTVSGTNTGDQTITLTGDVTGSGTGSFAATIANNAVTYAKIQNVSATDKLLGRSTAGAGVVEEITCTAYGRSLLDDIDATAARTTLGLGTLATQSGTFSGTSSGTNTGDQTITLSGDVSGTGTGSFSTTIANDAVTYAKLQNISAASRIIGRGSAAGAGDPQELTLGTGLELSGTTLNCTVSGAALADGDKGDITVSSSGATWTIDNAAVSYAKIQNVSATDKLLGRSTAGSGVIEEITCTSYGRSLLDDIDAAAARTTLGLGTLATQSGTFSGTSSGTNTGDQTITLTGDVTGSGSGSFAATIANDAVTYAKIQNVSAASRILGRGSSAGAGDAEELTIGTGLSLSGTTLSATATGVSDGDKGDITVSASGATWTIDNGVVSYAKIQNVSATDKLLGRSSVGAGSIEEVTCTAFGRSILDDVDAAAGRTTLGLGTLATQSGTFSGTSSGTNTGDQTIALTGDVTGSGTGSFAATIANNAVTTAKINNSAVTYAKIQNVSATDKLLGRSTAGAGVVEEITCTAFGRSLIDDADATAARTTLGLGTLATQSGTFSGTSSGTNTGDQTISLTGDVTGSGTGSFAATIANSAVSYAKIQNVSATDKLLGRSTAGAGVVEEIACTAFGRSLIDDADATAARTTLGLGTLATQSGTFSGTSSGTNTGDQTITLTGNVTGSGSGSFATTIANSVVTNAMLANVATQTFKGRTTAATGVVEDLTATQATAMLNEFSSSLKGLAPSSGGGTTNYLRADGTWASPPGSATSPGGSTTQVQYNNAGAFAGSANLTFDGTNTILGSSSQLQWSTDAILARDAANVIGQRNTTSPQTLRIYNTYTNSTAHERLALTWATNVAKIGTEKGTVGSARDLQLMTDGTDRINITAAGVIRFNNAYTFPTADGTANKVLVTNGAGALSFSAGSLTGTNSGDQTITLTGDVTGSGSGSFAATIANSAVSYAKIQNVSATDKLLGRSTAGAGVIEEITCTSFGRSLIDDADATAARTTLGLGTLATQSGTFSGTSSGTNTGDQTITLTGNVTGSGTGSFATTIANSAVTYAKIQNVSATDKLLGRSTAGSGVVEEITCTAFGRSLIDDADATAGRTTLGLGTLATQSGTFSGTSSGTNTGDQTITLSGDVSGSGSGAFTATIASDAVTYAKMQNVSAASRLLGRGSALGAGDPEELTIGTGLQISGTALSCTVVGISDGDKGDVTVSGTGATWTIDNSAVSYAKIQNISATDKLLGRSTAGAGVIEEITCTAFGRSLIDDADATAARTTLGLGTLATQSGTFSGTSSGTNTGDQTITLTGNVTGSGTGSFATTIANSAVTYAKIQNVSATDKLLGRSTAGSGVVEEITCTSFGRSLIDDGDAATARTTLGLGTLATQSGTFSGTSSGTNSGDQTITLTGDVTGSGSGSFAATIANSAVTNAKLANVATQTFKGRTTASTGVVEDLTATQATAMLDLFSSTLKGLTPSSGGGTTNFLRADGTWAAPAGSGGSPGGSSSQLQYNSSGSFAGASGLTTNGTTLTITGGTVTSSSPVLSMTQTWNAAAVTFTGLDFNVTNTSSASGSKLLDLRVGGSSVFNVKVDGTFTTTGNAVTGISSTQTTFQVGGTNGPGFAGHYGGVLGSFALFQNGSMVSYWSQQDNYLALPAAHAFGFSPSIFYSAPDVTLYRDEAGVLALKTGTNAQALRVYNGFVSSTYYERGVFDFVTTAGLLRIGTEKGSTGGVARAVSFVTDATERMSIGASGGVTINTSTSSFTLPTGRGSNGQVLQTDGAGGTSWATSSGGVSDGDKGDITVSASGATWTIDSGVVGNAKLANVATQTFKGRTTASTGVVEDLTATQATAMLDVFSSSLKGLAPSSGGGTTNFLRADGTWAAPSGSGGSPGGSTTQIQYNNAGAFGGASGLTTSGTNLTIAGGTLSSSSPSLSVTQTWNGSGVTFSAATINVTDTLSAAASLLFDCQVAGTSKFKVDKAGAVTATSSMTVASGAAYTFSSRSSLYSSADGFIEATANNGTTGAVVTSGGYRVQTDALVTAAPTSNNFNLLASHNGKTLVFSTGTAFTLTVSSGQSYPVGFSCTIITTGAGAATFTASGVTINSFGGYLATAGAHAVATIICTASNVFNIAGNLV